MNGFILAVSLQILGFVQPIVIFCIPCAPVPLIRIIGLIMESDDHLHPWVVHKFSNVPVRITNAHTADILGVFRVSDQHKCLCAVDALEIIKDRIAVLIETGIFSCPGNIHCAVIVVVDYYFRDQGCVHLCPA